jgi:hypothetical protein
MDTSRGSSTSGAHDSMHIVHHGETSLILRRDNLGMKVLVNTNYRPETTLSILEGERRVSNYLPLISPHRKVRHLDSYKGCFAFKFDWVEGVTVREWLRSLDKEQVEQVGGKIEEEGDLMTRLHVAIAIAKSVASLHEAGVTHGSIISDCRLNPNSVRLH